MCLAGSDCLLTSECSLTRTSRLCAVSTKKLNLHLVYVLSFFQNFLLSTSFVLQKGRRIPTLGLSSHQWTGIIVSSLFGFSKSRITSFTNFVGYPALMNDCLMALTSAFQMEVHKKTNGGSTSLLCGKHARWNQYLS